MSLISSLKRIYIRVESRGDSRFSVAREDQEKILNSFCNPKDNIERSYFQFKCQYLMMGWRRYLYQICSFFFLRIKLHFTSRIPPKQTGSTDLLCLMNGDVRSRVPPRLYSGYHSIRFLFSTKQEYITPQSLEWFKTNIRKRYRNEYFFQLQIYLHLIRYCYGIAKHSPKAIATNDEYSCSSSAMTEFCHFNSVKHINFMHGEKIWGIRDSFFCFDECYVWDDYYIALFKSLRAANSSYIVSLPDYFVQKTPNKAVASHLLSKCDFCYYLADETKSEVEKIISTLAQLQNAGRSVRVRIHPNWGYHKFIISCAKKYNVEVEPLGVDINTSIFSTMFPVSLFSTVLFQSHLFGKKIVIDDFCSKERYDLLKKLDYIAFKFDHALFSDMIKSTLGG